MPRVLAHSQIAAQQTEHQARLPTDCLSYLDTSGSLLKSPITHTHILKHPFADLCRSLCLNSKKRFPPFFRVRLPMPGFRRDTTCRTTCLHGAATSTHVRSFFASFPDRTIPSPAFTSRPAPFNMGNHRHCMTVPVSSPLSYCVTCTPLSHRLSPPCEHFTLRHRERHLTYKNAFDAPHTVDKIESVIKTTDRNLALLLWRALIRDS
ncbi:hypothetical protein EI94DRAFT_779804 [Lactarius quietus]|nr:hypothetical protein EI94DRAFT_779804 [Lactarius quietus]